MMRVAWRGREHCVGVRACVCAGDESARGRQAAGKRPRSTPTAAAGRGGGRDAICRKQAARCMSHNGMHQRYSSAVLTMSSAREEAG